LDMVAHCRETLMQHTLAAAPPHTAAAALAGSSKGSGSSPQIAVSSSGATHPQQQQQQQQGVTSAAVTLPRRPSFMPLPLNYQDLYLSLSDVECGACGRVPEHPALCLVTGR
jgi:hypothetical protein